MQLREGGVYRVRGSNTRVIYIDRHFLDQRFCLILAEESGGDDGHKAVRLVSQPGESSEKLVVLLPKLFSTDWLEKTSNSAQCEDFEQLLEDVKHSKELRCMQYRYEDHPPLTVQPLQHLQTTDEAVVGQVYGVSVSLSCTEKRPKPRPGLYLGQGVFLPIYSFHREEKENGKCVTIVFQTLECVFKEEALYASQHFIPAFPGSNSQYIHVTIEPPLLMKESYIYAVEHKVPVEKIRRLSDLGDKENRQNFKCRSKVGKEDYDKIVRIVKNEKSRVFGGVGHDGSGEGTKGGNGEGTGGGNGGNIVNMGGGSGGGYRGGGSGGGYRGGGSGGGNSGGGSGGGNSGGGSGGGYRGGGSGGGNSGGGSGGGNSGGGRGGGAQGSGTRSDRREQGGRKQVGGQGQGRPQGSEEEVERAQVEESSGSKNVKTVHESQGPRLVYELTEDLEDLDWSWDGSSPWLPIYNLEMVNLLDIDEERSDTEKAKMDHQSHSSSLVYELTEDLDDLDWSWDGLSPWLPICDLKILAPIVTFGELLIDFVPTVAGLSLSDAPAFKKAAGGSPANVAVGVSKLGGRAAFIGKVGDDDFGHMLVDTLKSNHVDVTGIRHDVEARTALAFVTLREDGEREFIFYRNPSADMMMTPAELDLDLIRNSEVFHYGSISLIADPSRLTHFAALKLAKDSGSLLSYDPNLRLPLWPSPEAAREGIKSIWDQADIIKVSDEEVKFLTNGGDETRDDVVLSLWHDNLKLLLVTDGPAGCRYYTPYFHGRVESFQVETVDTTGAGDAFVAGLLNELVRNKGLLTDERALRAALTFANACGAITTTGRGAIPSLPEAHSVWNLIHKASAPAAGPSFV